MVTIFNGAALTGTFVASTPFIMSGERITLDFDLVVTLLADVEWFLEFASGNPLAAATTWRREVAEEDVGSGVTNMPKVVRHFQENGGAALAAGTHNLSAHFVRAHQFARIQIRVASGTVTNATVNAIFGDRVSVPQ